MAEFLIFYAPFLVLIASIIVSFWLVGKDEKVK
ncbi:cytochrome bd oxidase small subunit CydS [Mesobacillus subterraneus]|uniref:Uncharacterized protein n=1 Tax=Mesobacillus stamsii TaxID=225347 RepID=A0ABU0FTS7_9BACI|nr:hypothetical protein [Mesobacillus stamsii]